jgi:hypothetical protein
MDEATARKWDIIIKIVATLGVAIGGCWTYYVFRDDHNKDKEHQQQLEQASAVSRKQELNSYIFQKQASLYLEIADTASIIATSRDKTAIARAKERFIALSNGDVLVVEDRPIQLSILTIKRCLETDEVNCYRYPFTQRHQPIPEPADKGAKLGPPSMLSFSMELSACVRSAFEKERGLDFGSKADEESPCPYE